MKRRSFLAAIGLAPFAAWLSSRVSAAPALPSSTEPTVRAWAEPVRLAAPSARNCAGYHGWTRISVEGVTPQVTATVLHQCVAELHARPGFKVGADGNCCEPLIPWDRNHGMYDGSPMLALPRTLGWSSDLRVVTHDGVAELWALTRFFDDAPCELGPGDGFSSALTIGDHASIDGLVKGARLTSASIAREPMFEPLMRAGFGTTTRDWVRPMIASRFADDGHDGLFKAHLDFAALCDFDLTPDDDA